MMTLFSGYESQMMALQRAMSSNDNFVAELVGWSDINEIVQSIHNAVYPEYADRCYPDVTKIRWEEVEDFDILFASSPCQDVSRLGMKRGMKRGDTTRSSLVWEVERAIASKRPKFFIEENVAGMLDYQEDFEELVRTVSSYGYACYFRTFTGADFGIPQNRPRMFLVAIRIDSDDYYPVFTWPEPTGIQVTPEDLLSDNVDDKYYLTEEEKATYLDLIRNAKPGYTAVCSTHGKSPKRYLSSQFCRCVSRFVTPLCSKNHSIPTLIACGTGGTLETIAGCRRENQAGVLEIWEGTPGLQPVMTNEPVIDRLIKVLKPCCEKDRVLAAVENLPSNHYLRVRCMTPAEHLRFMGVDEKHVNRIIHPHETLLQDGYSEQWIKENLFPHKNDFKFSDYALYGRAGNSIVVNVIAAIFSKVLEHFSESKTV